MCILVIDGQGGGIGKGLVERLRVAFPHEDMIAVGTNSLATANMMKAGATACATGENAVVVNSARANFILGPIGIVMANSLLGEITPLAACAVASSAAKKILIPVERCHTSVAGVQQMPLGKYMDEAITLLKSCLPPQEAKV